MKSIIIKGSARKEGGLDTAVKVLVEHSGWEPIDLNDYDIGHFDYSHANKADDFIPLMRRILIEENYDNIIFATPVYWYSMSGVMKVFFDRFTDLLTIEKELGRKLRGRKMAGFTSSGGGNLGEQFWLPFRETAGYLGMDFIGGLHTIASSIDKEGIEQFVSKVNNA